MFEMHLGRTREKIVAVADIGSGSAALAIISVPKKGPARVLSAERRFLPPEERVGDAITAAIGTHLVEVGKSVLAAHAKKGGAQPGSVYAIIRAPWTNSKTMQSEMLFSEPTQITDAMIGGLARKALASDKELDKARLLEAEVIRIEVNGYPTIQPEETTGQRLSVSALISDCNPKFRTTLTHALQQLFGGQKIILRSGVHAILSALRTKARLPHEDFLVVDMAGEGTNFIVIRDGITTDHATIPEGKNSLLKRIGGTDMTENTSTILRLSAQGECHDSACQAINVAMAKAEPELVRIFGDVMGKLVSKHRLPNSLVLATHDNLVPWLSSFFSRIDFAQFTTTTQPFSVNPLRPDDLKQLAIPEGSIHVDTGILVAAALVNIEEGRA